MLMASPIQLAALKNVAPAAQVCAQQWGVPASVTLAQWIYESTWGTSQLAREANNYFGIKAVPSEAYMEFPTHEVVQGRSVLEMAKFASYGTMFESFAAHGKLLASLSRYAPAMLFAKQPTTFAVALQRCGYSTSPTYAARLQIAMRDYNLQQYDTPPPAQPAMAQEAA